MSDCPPSSKRRPLTTTDIPVTLESNAMWQLKDSVAKNAMRGRYVLLVVHPDDGPELVSLATHVTERRGEQDPVVLREEVTIQRIRDVAKEIPSARGVVLLRGESVRDEMCQEVTDLLCGSPPRALVIVAFATREACETVTTAWPADLRRTFTHQPIEWPRLGNRRADLEGIIHQLCCQCVTRDGRIVATLTNDALETLIRDVIRNPGTRIASLRSRISQGFTNMLRSNEREITARHLNGRTSNRPRATPSSQPSPPT